MIDLITEDESSPNTSVILDHESENNNITFSFQILTIQYSLPHPQERPVRCFADVVIPKIVLSSK
jgi:hypothetical protein